MNNYVDYTVGEPVSDSAAPDGSIDTRWERHRFGVKLVNPSNKRRMKVIVVGTGLAVALVVGYLSVPFAVMTGLVK